MRDLESDLEFMLLLSSVSPQDRLNPWKKAIEDYEKKSVHEKMR